MGVNTETPPCEGELPFTLRGFYLSGDGFVSEANNLPSISGTPDADYHLFSTEDWRLWAKELDNVTVSAGQIEVSYTCLLYTSPSPRD